MPDIGSKLNNVGELTICADETLNLIDEIDKLKIGSRRYTVDVVLKIWQKKCKLSDKEVEKIKELIGYIKSMLDKEDMSEVVKHADLVKYDVMELALKKISRLK